METREKFGNSLNLANYAANYSAASGFWLISSSKWFIYNFAATRFRLHISVKNPLHSFHECHQNQMKISSFRKMIQFKAAFQITTRIASCAINFAVSRFKFISTMRIDFECRLLRQLVAAAFGSFVHRTCTQKPDRNSAEHI